MSFVLAQDFGRTDKVAQAKETVRIGVTTTGRTGQAYVCVAIGFNVWGRLDPGGCNRADVLWGVDRDRGKLRVRVHAEGRVKAARHRTARAAAALSFSSQFAPAFIQRGEHAREAVAFRPLEPGEGPGIEIDLPDWIVAAAGEAASETVEKVNIAPEAPAAPSPEPAPEPPEAAEPEAERPSPVAPREPEALRSPGDPWTPALKVAFCEAYHRGDSVGVLQARFGISPSTINVYASQWGVSRQRRGAPEPAAAGLETPDQADAPEDEPDPEPPADTPDSAPDPAPETVEALPAAGDGDEAAEPAAVDAVAFAAAYTRGDPIAKIAARFRITEAEVYARAAEAGLTAERMLRLNGGPPDPAPAPRRDTAKVRPCLRCKAQFKSAHSGNRMCVSCSRISDSGLDAYEVGR